MGIHPFTIVLFVLLSLVGVFQGMQTRNPIYIVVGLGLGLLLLLSVRIAKQWQKVMVLRLGKFSSLQGPGAFGVIPFLDTIPSFVDTRIITTPFTAEKTLTKDSVPVDVDAVLFWRVLDPKKAVLEVEDYKSAISWASQTALRDVIGETDLSEMLIGRRQIDSILCKSIDERTEAWGIKALSVELRDVKIPTELQNAMSMQAQAERERQARVILAESERQVAFKFYESAKAYENSPVALHLRAMNILLEGMRQSSTIIVVPSTAVETMGLGVVGGITSLAKEFQGPKEKKEQTNSQ
ncbi:MAG: slipin family protein [Planctomycetes bacterium]|nr:slipin family protein [Planctomycetota bacterium]